MNANHHRLIGASAAASYRQETLPLFDLDIAAINAAIDDYLRRGGEYPLICTEQGTL